MIHELDAVALNVNLPAHGLKKGDVGTVVLLHRDGEMEVEFVAYSGDTVALVHLQAKQVLPVGRNDVPHVRHRIAPERQRASKAQAR